MAFPREAGLLDGADYSRRRLAKSTPESIGRRRATPSHLEIAVDVAVVATYG